jgi:hypothetical protein
MGRLRRQKGWSEMAWRVGVELEDELELEG